MMRRLFNLAGVLSLLAAALLGNAGFTQASGRAWWIGHHDGPLAVVLCGGRLDVVRNNHGAFVGAPISVQLGTLAWALILPAAVWAVVSYRDERRRPQATGCPAESIQK
ncbi:MAG TPA: hypothetical protein VGI81_24680 [Tepidisphaeraceae bacterium]|jgi:hypothetical protein